MLWIKSTKMYSNAKHVTCNMNMNNWTCSQAQLGRLLFIQLLVLVYFLYLIFWVHKFPIKYCVLHLQEVHEIKYQIFQNASQFKETANKKILASRAISIWSKGSRIPNLTNNEYNIVSSPLVLFWPSLSQTRKNLTVNNTNRHTLHFQQRKMAIYGERVRHGN